MLVDLACACFLVRFQIRLRKLCRATGLRKWPKVISADGGSLLCPPCLTGTLLAEPAVLGQLLRKFKKDRDRLLAS